MASGGCVLLVAFGGGWLLAAGSSSSTTADGEVGRGELVGQVDAGRVADIYRRDCAVCHGADGQGSSSAPDLAGSGLALVEYMLSTGRMPIDDPDEQLSRSEPAYDRETIDALVAYLGELQDGAVADGPEIPEIDLAAGDVAAGGEIWRQECAACHAWSGVGGAMLRRSVPGVREATPAEMAAAVRSGPLEMPRYGEVTITREELDNLAAFFEEELKEPDDTGGWSLGHVGPVTEGAIALALGLGVLGVAARVIGAGREHR